MKNLVDILEKLDINKVNIKDKGFVKNFPLNSEIEEIAKYLKNYGFREIEWPIISDFGEFKQDIEKENGRVFARYKNVMVRFANTSIKKIENNNPVFVINKLPSTTHLYFEFNKWWELRNIKPDDFLAKIEKCIL